MVKLLARSCLDHIRLCLIPVAIDGFRQVGHVMPVGGSWCLLGTGWRMCVNRPKKTYQFVKGGYVAFSLFAHIGMFWG